jgi:hypothetical protein
MSVGSPAWCGRRRVAVGGTVSGGAHGRAVVAMHCPPAGGAPDAPNIILLILDTVPSSMNSTSVHHPGAGLRWPVITV